MKTKTNPAVTDNFISTKTFWNRLNTGWLKSLTVFGLMVLSIQPGNTADLTWDPGNTSNGGTIDSGDGPWDLTSMIWNNGAGDVAWTQSSTTVPLNNAIFDGAGGAYLVTVGATQIAVSNVLFSASGYTVSAGEVYVLKGGALGVAAGKVATVNSLIGDNSNDVLLLTNNTGSILNLGGGFAASPQAQFLGVGTINITGGTYGITTAKFFTSVINQTGGSVNLTGSGSTGNWINYNAGHSVNYTISGGSLNLNGSGAGAYLSLGRGNGNTTAILTVQNNGMVNIGTNGPGQINIPQDNNSNGKLDVQGGTLTVGTGDAGNQIYLFPGGANSGKIAAMTLEGGMTTVQGIQFGSASGSYSTGSTASLAMTGGSLYVGNLGIVEGASHATDSVMLSGGIVGAAADWNSAMDIDLGSVGGPVTIQAADVEATAHNITLAGILSGTQGFIKTGAGILTLSGANTYSGMTVINTGTLALSGNGAVDSTSGISLVAGATLDVSSLSSSTFILNSGAMLSASGAGTTMGSTAATIVGNASGTVDLGTDNIILNYDGSNPALYVSSGTLQLEGNQWTINSAAPISSVGTYVIAHVDSGNIVASGTPTVTGTAVAGAMAHIAFSGGDVQLVVDSVGAPVTVSGLTANNKIYDATTQAIINTNGYTLSGVAPGDVGNVYLVTNGYTALFDTANVGVGKAVAVSGLSLGGSAASGYYIQQPAMLTANVTNATTALTLICANTNVYTGRPYIFLASLTSMGWLPTNEPVTFTTNGVVMGVATLNAPSLASLFMTLAPGIYTVTAEYAGDANVYGSTNTATFALGTSGASGWVWDADTGLPGAQDGSGVWAATPVNWWNGTADITWDSTDAAFGGGADGSYTVNLTNAISVNSITFNNSGYNLIGANPINLTGSRAITVATNKIATISCGIGGGNNAEYFTAQSNALLNISGNMAGTQPHFNGEGVINLSGTNTPALFNVKSTVVQNGGSMSPQVYSFIAYVDAGNYGSYTITNSSLTMNGGDLSVARGGNTGKLIIQNGGAVAFESSGSTVRNLNIASSDNSGNNHGMLDVQGGALIMGSSSALCPINLMTAGGGNGETAVMTQEGGTITVWGGIIFGGTGAYGTCTNSYTMIGGSLYLASAGFIQGVNHPSSSTITLSGGTVGALQNWSTTIPVTLGTANGNVTMQCADAFGSPWNVTLAGGLNGSGGLNKSGAGTLNLSGIINYAGSTVISNGTFVVPAVNMPTSGPITLNGSAGSPTVSVSVTGAGQFWSIGDLTYNSGTPTADFQFDSIPPSTTTAPIQVAGNVDFAVTPNVNIGGTAIAAGTYPLIQYTGVVSGTVPTAVTLPGALSAAGYVTNMTDAKTIALVVTSSSYNPALYWAVGSGVWDVNATANWLQNGSPVNYMDGNAVVFDDTASGPSPIIVTLNTAVNPWNITANNKTNSYTITGSGSIIGSSGLTMLGNGVLTLGGVNTYSGGTVLNAGQLNINNGGDGGGGTAIGTGTLTIKAGTAIDNTSGSNVTLLASIPEVWDGGFTYLGAANSLNMGSGSVSMNQNLMVTVNSNTLAVGGTISDNGNNYTLTKGGNGALSLEAGNSIGKGVTLLSGLLNLGSGSSVGFGTFEIDGGSIDNISGADMTLSSSAVTWGGNFNYVGSANNVDFGGATVLFVGNVTLNVVNNTVITEGILSAGNASLTKNGNGTLTISGSAANSGMPLIVNGGRVNLDKSAGQVINLATSATPGLTVNSNALVVITGTSGDQIRDGVGGAPNPVKLNSGVFDLNGQSEAVDSVSITNGGALRNGTAFFSFSTLTVDGTNVISLNGSGCGFDVPADNAELDIAAVVAGNGSLLKTGAGVVDLYSNTTYTGSTTINAGTLIINYPSLATNSPVSVAAGGILNLNFPNGETNTVSGLVIGGVSYSPGVYNASTDPSYLQGSGNLLVQPSIATNPTNIVLNVSGNTLSLSWPADHQGWILQTQTNSLGVGLGTNWMDVPGSDSITSTNITINPANPTMFFRLRSPL